MAPLDNISFETYLKETDSDKNEEEYMEIQKTYGKIKRLEKADNGNHTLFKKDRIITINNNY